MVKELENWTGGERDKDVMAEKRRMWATLKKWVKIRKDEDREEERRKEEIKKKETRKVK